MDPILSLHPEPVWRYFAALSAIPRASGAEGEAADWVAAVGRRLGLGVERDRVGNVLIRRPASPGYEGAPPVTMQAHVDMVCEKNEETVHDFSRDPIRLRVDDDCVRATGTTLGADCGIGLAAGLAILSASTLVHGPIELLVTVDEESGMTGAQQLQAGWLRGKYLLNLDMEEMGKLTIGCAGGIDTVATRAPRWEPAPEGAVAVRIKVSGAKGGHSGVDIHLGRANAIRLLAQVLDGLPVDWHLSSLNVGNKRNAIPREASAVVVIEGADLSALRAAVSRAEVDWRILFGTVEPGLSIRLRPAEARRVMGEADRRGLIGLLLTLPHGVESMSPDVPGLVLTSTNLGVVATLDEVIEVTAATRSAVEAGKRALARRVAMACAMAGFSTREEGGYPGWRPVPGRALLRTIDEVWRGLGHGPMEIMAIHAGLECGLIGERYPQMEMVSFGPDMWDAHTPDERVSIASVGAFYALLRAVVERLAQPVA